MVQEPPDTGDPPPEESAGGAGAGAGAGAACDGAGALWGCAWAGSLGAGAGVGTLPEPPPEDPEPPEPEPASLADAPVSPSDCGSANGGIFGAELPDGPEAPAARDDEADATPEVGVTAPLRLLNVRPGATEETRPARPAVSAAAPATVQPRVLRIRASAASRASMALDRSAFRPLIPRKTSNVD